MFSIENFIRFARPAALAACVCAAALASPSRAQTAPPSPPTATPAPQEVEPPDQGDASTGAPVQLASRPALVFSGTGEWDDGLRAIMDAFDKLRDQMGKSGLRADGRPIAIFTDTDDKGFKFEAMVPLSSAPPAELAFDAGVKAGATPAGKAMKFEHRGSYDDIDSTYEAITAYLDEKGLEAQNLFIEEYLSTPKSADDQDLEIDIYVFIK